MDLLYFFSVPIFVILATIIMYRGKPTRYKIVQEIDDLGETRYELWFKYGSLMKSYPWCLEGVFDTKQEAEASITKKNIDRKIIQEGDLKW